MDEPRDSPQRRQQFLVICTIMAGIFLHTCTVSGVFSSLNIKEGIFPGGEFVYKYDVRYVTIHSLKKCIHLRFSAFLTPFSTVLLFRDYSTSAGLARSIIEDLAIGEIDQGDFLYSVFLDSPMAMGGATQRFATGILVDKTGRDKKKQLMGMNEGIRAIKYTDDDDYSVDNVWKQIEYKSTSLPSLDAAVVQFPFTNGFVSALTHSYKVRWKGLANRMVRYLLQPNWS